MLGVFFAATAATIAVLLFYVVAVLFDGSNHKDRWDRWKTLELAVGCCLTALYQFNRRIGCHPTSYTTAEAVILRQVRDLVDIRLAVAGIAAAAQDIGSTGYRIANDYDDENERLLTVYERIDWSERRLVWRVYS